MPTLRHETEKVTIAFRCGASIVELCDQVAVLLDLPATDVYRQAFIAGLGPLLQGVNLTLDTSVLLEDFGAPNAFKTSAKKATAFRFMKAEKVVQVAKAGKTRSKEDRAS
jgi:hypothetical protein